MINQLEGHMTQNKNLLNSIIATLIIEYYLEHCSPFRSSILAAI